jgi:hypothetical protein
LDDALHERGEELASLTAIVENKSILTTIAKFVHFILTHKLGE